MKVEAVEPWLRNTHTDLDAVRRQVVHALEQAGEDIARWCAGLGDDEVNARPCGVASVAFHLRHIARSLDRLTAYAEGHALTEVQMALLQDEAEPAVSADFAREECRVGLDLAVAWMLRVDPAGYEQRRGVGRAGLPSTLGGLMVHCAEHTQRHVGQVIVVAQVVRRMRGTL